MDLHSTGCAAASLRAPPCHTHPCATPCGVWPTRAVAAPPGRQRAVPPPRPPARRRQHPRARWAQAVALYGAEHGNLRVPAVLVELWRLIKEQLDADGARRLRAAAAGAGASRGAAGLFRVSGSASGIRELQATADAGAALPDDAGIYELSAVFKAYLRQLPEWVAARRCRPSAAC